MINTSTEGETLILNHLKNHPEGLDEASLSKLLTNLDDLQKADCLNHLIAKSRIQVLQKSNGMPVFKYVSEEQAYRIKDMSMEE